MDKEQLVGISCKYVRLVGCLNTDVLFGKLIYVKLLVFEYFASFRQGYQIII